MEGKFNQGKIPKITSSLNNPINAEKLIDDFEENTARARLMYPGRIFVTGFSDGVKEHTGSEGTSFYLQLKGTKDDPFDMDYLYIEKKFYYNIRIIIIKDNFEIVYGS